MSRAAARICLLLLVLCPMLGCDATPADPHPAPIDSGAAASASGQDESVTVEIASWAEVENAIASHRGKVVVVDVWSTSCVPCMREFPGLVALHRQFADVACLSVNIDYYGDPTVPPAQSKDEVLSFLNQQQATFPNFLSSDADTDVLNNLKITSVPAVLVYDRAGQLSKLFVNENEEYGEEGFTYAQHITPLVASLRAE